MGTARVLFWLGILVIVVEFFSYLRTMVIMEHSIMNIGILATPLWQGGLLIGLSKIIQLLHKKE